MAPSAERLVVFTDAVAAIALTLLVLPLAAVIPDATDQPIHLATLVKQNLHSFMAFVLSFSVIFRLWWSHHQIFRHIARLHGTMVWWSIMWTFAIVFLPVPTAIVITYEPSAITVALYGLALVLASGALTMMAMTAYRHPEYSGDRPAISRRAVTANLVLLLTQLTAVGIGCLFSQSISHWAFVLMFAATPIEYVLTRRWEDVAP